MGLLVNGLLVMGLAALLTADAAPLGPATYTRGSLARRNGESNPRRLAGERYTYYGPGYRRPPAYPWDTYNPYTSWWPFNYPAYTLDGNPYRPGILRGQYVYPGGPNPGYGYPGYVQGSGSPFYGQGGVSAPPVYIQSGGTATAPQYAYTPQTAPQTAPQSGGTSSSGSGGSSGGGVTGPTVAPPPGGSPPGAQTGGVSVGNTIAPPPGATATEAPVTSGSTNAGRAPMNVKLTKAEVKALFQSFDITPEDVRRVLDERFGITDPASVEKAIKYMVDNNVPVRGRLKAQGPPNPSVKQFLDLVGNTDRETVTYGEVQTALAQYYGIYDEAKVQTIYDVVRID
eukprot:Selendium_serpulae@DN5345_c0_g1_i1.p1